MQQQLPVAALGVVQQVGVAVGADAGAHQEHLAPPELHEGVAEVEPALPDGLHLGAGEAHPGLRPLEDLVVEEGLAVRGNRRFAGLLLRHPGIVAPIQTPPR